MYALLVQIPDAELPSVSQFKESMYDHSFPHVLAWAGALITVLAAFALMRALATR